MQKATHEETHKTNETNSHMKRANKQQLCVIYNGTKSLCLIKTNHHKNGGNAKNCE